MLYPCEHTLFITLSLSEGILRRGGGGEKRQEIINSPSSPRSKVREEQRERVNQRVSGGPGPAHRGHLQLPLSHSHTHQKCFEHTDETSRAKQERERLKETFKKTGEKNDHAALSKSSNISSIQARNKHEL